MSKEFEQQLRAELYYQAFNLIASESGGLTPGFRKDNTFVILGAGHGVRPADFYGMASAANPEHGDLAKTEMFARFVDALPIMKPDYVRSTSTVSEVYRSIVNGANTSIEVDSAQKDIYEKAYKYLNEEVELKDYTGKIVKSLKPSPIANAYAQNSALYANALAGYRTLQASLDLSNPQDQQIWLAKSVALRNTIDIAYNKWRNEGAELVEEAQDVLASSINNAVTAAIADAQRRMRSGRLASFLPGGGDWYMTYSSPADWVDENAAAGFSEFRVDSRRLNSSAMSTYEQYGGSGSYGIGLWSFGAGFDKSKSTQTYHMKAENIQVNAKVGVIYIIRPWIDTFLFKLKHWWVIGIDRNGISNGSSSGNKDNVMPIIPTAFVAMRDVRIKGNFSEIDRSRFEESMQASGRVGWGPFGISGRYESSQSGETYQSTYVDGELRIPGVQILGWVGEIVPPSPPDDPRTKR